MGSIISQSQGPPANVPLADLALQRCRLAFAVVEALAQSPHCTAHRGEIEECLQWFYRPEPAQNAKLGAKTLYNTGVLIRLELECKSSNGAPITNGHRDQGKYSSVKKAANLAYRVAAFAAEIRALELALFTLTVAIKDSASPAHKSMLPDLHRSLDDYMTDQAAFLQQSLHLPTDYKIGVSDNPKVVRLAELALDWDSRLESAEAVLDFNKRGIFSGLMLQALLNNVEQIRDRLQETHNAYSRILEFGSLQRQFDNMQAVANRVVGMPHHMVSVVTTLAEVWSAFEDSGGPVDKSLNKWLRDDTAGLSWLWNQYQHRLSSSAEAAAC